jgi:hypothetical protein
VQPVPFSHALHSGQLGIDCRYCHVGVDKSAVSSVPAAQTCMNCHNQVKTDSPLLQVVRDSYASGDPVPWVKIHQAPDYVYFNHSVHIARGVSCVECHGKINEMEVVGQAKSLSMGFCLDCHREPENLFVTQNLLPISTGSTPRVPKDNCVTAKSSSTTGTSIPRKAAPAAIADPADETHI